MHLMLTAQTHTRNSFVFQHIQTYIFLRSISLLRDLLPLYGSQV